jgi:hypothetical protein
VHPAVARRRCGRDKPLLCTIFWCRTVTGLSARRPTRDRPIAAHPRVWIPETQREVPPSEQERQPNRHRIVPAAHSRGSGRAPGTWCGSSGSPECVRSGRRHSLRRPSGEAGGIARPGPPLAARIVASSSTPDRRWSPRGRRGRPGVGTASARSRRARSGRMRAMLRVAGVDPCDVRWSTGRSRAVMGRSSPPTGLAGPRGRRDGGRPGAVTLVPHPINLLPTISFELTE